MARLIHSMLRVLEEERSVRFYKETLCLHVVEKLVFDTFTLVYLAGEDGPFELELTINHGRTEPYDLGTAYGHLAVSVADAQAEYDRLSAAGYPVTPVKTMTHGNGENARVVGTFFFLTDPDGYRIEVLERGAPGRFV